jgi:hypothetical protein
MFADNSSIVDCNHKEISPMGEIVLCLRNENMITPEGHVQIKGGSKSGKTNLLRSLIYTHLTNPLNSTIPVTLFSTRQDEYRDLLNFPTMFSVTSISQLSSTTGLIVIDVDGNYSEEISQLIAQGVDTSTILYTGDLTCKDLGFKHLLYTGGLDDEEFEGKPSLAISTPGLVSWESKEGLLCVYRVPFLPMHKKFVGGRRSEI